MRILKKRDKNYPKNREKFLKYLNNGKVALIDSTYQEIYIKFIHCQKLPDIRWHTSEQTFFQTFSAFGINKNLDKKIIKSLNEMLFKIFLTISTILNIYVFLFKNSIDNLISNGVLMRLTEDCQKIYPNIRSSKMEECIHEKYKMQSEFKPINFINIKQLFVYFYCFSFSVTFILIIEILSKFHLC